MLKGPVKLEGIWTITVSSVLIQILWQVDNLNGLKRAFLHAKAKKLKSMKKGYNRNLMISRRTLTHIPHPMHNSSEIKAIFDCGVTSMHSFPVKREGPKEKKKLITINLGQLNPKIRKKFSGKFRKPFQTFLVSNPWNDLTSMFENLNILTNLSLFF